MRFFLLVFALSVRSGSWERPAAWSLLPGLPVAGLMAFCPLLAACILVSRREGGSGVLRLLERGVDPHFPLLAIPLLFLVFLGFALAEELVGIRRRSVAGWLALGQSQPPARGGLGCIAGYHTMVNVSWQLFPNHGSDYDPRITGPILALIATIIARPNLPFIQLQQRAPGGSACESGRH
jgi:hypothetical protein